MILSVGTAVPWAPAPGGIAQVDDLLRRRVRLVYRCKNGRLRRPVVPASRLVDRLLFNLHNPLDRGCPAKTRAYAVEA